MEECRFVSDNFFKNMCIGRLHVTEHGNTVYAKTFVQYKHVRMYMYSTPTDTK